MLTTTLVALALAQAQPAAPKPEVIDASAFRDKLTLLTDGKNHYVTVDPNARMDFVFTSGDGKTFSKVRTQGGGRDGEIRWNVAMWDPRMWAGDGQLAGLTMYNPNAAAGTDGGSPGTRPIEYTVTCAKKTTAMTVVPAADAKKLLTAATFVGAVFTRYPEKLLRDDSGNYYLVDRFRSADPSDRRDFRVWAGPKGNMKLLPLKDIVDDSQGMILSTRNGNLRLITTTDGKVDSKWVQGKEHTPLVEVDLGRYDTARMIYLDLGPYTGQRLGTPCDDLM
ncbi:MAG: hypothetical protein JNM17_30105 [Archangium sp.]|nr:hypothetical protein [Archangium sp.]